MRFQAAPGAQHARDAGPYRSANVRRLRPTEPEQRHDESQLQVDDEDDRRTGEPRSKAEVVALLETEGETFASYLAELPDAFLAEMVTMMPGRDQDAKSRFEMLLGVKEHEMHHRGQLMLLERMIGIVPHLTRQMEERMAQWQAAQAQK
jgi:uncharacterized damage-inducible protein DinB